MQLQEGGREARTVGGGGGVTAWFPNAPWWLLSAGIHLVLLAALLAYLGHIEVEESSTWHLLMASVRPSGTDDGTTCAANSLKATAGGPPEHATDDAVLAALRWLARHQNPDGSWGADAFRARCAGLRCSGAGIRDYDVGVTALALLAFLGAGFTDASSDQLVDPADPLPPRPGETIEAATQWLAARQDAEGCVGRRGPRYMYNHAVATLALCRAYGMTLEPALQEPAQRAVDFLVAAQNPGAGWRYSARSGDNDSSVTGWCVMALRSAEISGLSFPRRCYKDAIAWFDSVTDGDSRCGYARKADDRVHVHDRNERFDGHPSMSAIAALSRISVSQWPEPGLDAVKSLLDDLPQWMPYATDSYYWYFASTALFQHDGPDGSDWERWSASLVAALMPNQKTIDHGCAHGSWSPEEDRWGFEGGRVYTTALNALTLEVYYRYRNGAPDPKQAIRARAVATEVRAVEENFLPQTLEFESVSDEGPRKRFQSFPSPALGRTLRPSEPEQGSRGEIRGAQVDPDVEARRLMAEAQRLTEGLSTEMYESHFGIGDKPAILGPGEPDHQRPANEEVYSGE